MSASYAANSLYKDIADITNTPFGQLQLKTLRAAAADRKAQVVPSEFDDALQKLTAHFEDVAQVMGPEAVRVAWEVSTKGDFPTAEERELLNEAATRVEEAKLLSKSEVKKLVDTIHKHASKW